MICALLSFLFLLNGIYKSHSASIELAVILMFSAALEFSVEMYAIYALGYLP